MGDIELTCDAGMTNEHENDNSETARKEGLEPREMYDALRRVVFQKQKCRLKGVGNIRSASYVLSEDLQFRWKRSITRSR